MRALAFAAAAVTLALLLAGCGQGGPPADLFVVTRTGDVRGADLQLRITDDGGAFCNRAGREDITSEQLITAREIRRALDGEKDDEDGGLADRSARFAPGARTIFGYAVRSEDGVVTFADSSQGLPTELAQLIKLTRDVARGPCKLKR